MSTLVSKCCMRVLALNGKSSCCQLPPMMKDCIGPCKLSSFIMTYMHSLFYDHNYTSPHLHQLASCSTWMNDNSLSSRHLVEHWSWWPCKKSTWCIRDQISSIFLGKGWVCLIGSQWIVKQLVVTLHAHVNSILAEKYWKHKFKLLETLWDSIEWQVLDQVYKESSIAMQWWAVKYTSGFFAHGKNMAQWNFYSVSSCPRCTEVIEDKAHIMQYTSKGAQQTWDQCLNKVQHGLTAATWHMKYPRQFYGAPEMVQQRQGNNS